MIIINIIFLICQKEKGFKTYYTTTVEWGDRRWGVKCVFLSRQQNPKLNQGFKGLIGS